jgi:hypothetical protein
MLRRLPGVFNLIRTRITLPVEETIKIAICNAYRYLGRPLPLSLRGFYLMDIYIKAIESYTPELYRGRLTLCHSDKVLYCRQSEVSCLARGGAEAYEVPGAGHENIVEEPHVKVWAQYLKMCLDQVHAKTEEKKG